MTTSQSESSWWLQMIRIKIFVRCPSRCTLDGSGSPSEREDGARSEPDFTCIYGMRSFFYDRIIIVNTLYTREFPASCPRSEARGPMSYAAADGSRKYRGDRMCQQREGQVALLTHDHLEIC